MNLLRSFLLLPTLAFSLAAHAVTIEPLPGSTPQTTRQMAFFPVDLGVVVRDDEGQPAAGVTVRFEGPLFGTSGRGFWPDAPYPLDVITDANGVAIPAPNFVATEVGPVFVSATTLTPTPAATTFSLTVAPGAATGMSVVSGSNQRAVIGTTYGLPWAVRSFDAQGPVPYTLVQFFARLDSDGFPSGTFAGKNTLWAKADANGVATSPPFTANLVAGPYFGDASSIGPTSDDPSPFVFFTYNNLAVADTVTLYTSSVEVAVGSTNPYAALAQVTRGGAPVPSERFRYAVDPGCATFVDAFGNPASGEGLTDGNGWAVSPLIHGLAAATSCPFTITVDSGPGAIAIPLHVFNWASLVMTPQPASVASVTGAPFRIIVFLAESGLPISSASAMPASVIFNANRNGSSAVLARDPTGGLPANALFFDFVANDKQGDYSITLAVGGGAQRITVPVSQRKR